MTPVYNAVIHADKMRVYRFRQSSMENKETPRSHHRMLQELFLLTQPKPSKSKSKNIVVHEISKTARGKKKKKKRKKKRKEIGKKEHVVI
jgi:hypothetical protein